MMSIRIYDPVGLLAKGKELRAIRRQIEDLLERKAELMEEKEYYSKASPRKRRAAR
ncbi:MAG TPA: hypothetical protein VFE46_07845 [Pirellulales bacterium]|jgi:hypothetical protein|nr:hypothetical protein [Pirellulales bacterium]